MGQTRRLLITQVTLGAANMLLDAGLALGLGLGVDGVALGTVLAELLGLIIGVGLALPLLPGGRLPALRLQELTQGLGRVLVVNVDLMIRTMSLITVFAWFTAQGARQGAIVLAANAVLMQLVGAAAHVLDGIANTVEALAGQAFGARDRAALGRVMRVAGVQAVALAFVLTAAMGFGGPWIIAWLTEDTATRDAALEALPWAAGVPLVGVAAYLLDGLFIGTTRSAAMRNAMLVSLGIFLLAWKGLRPYGNQGLWAAMFVHYAARALTQAVALPALWRTARSA